MSNDGDVDGGGGGNPFSSWEGDADSHDSMDEALQRTERRRRKALISVVVAVLLGGTVTAMYSSGGFGPPTVVSPTINARLRHSVETLEAAARSGDVKDYIQAHADAGDALSAWIEDFSEHASLDTAFTIGGDEVCEGCTLVPKAVKALSQPVPAKVVANMTQLDKDRFDLKKIPWAIINAFLPAFEQMCDRYVDPATGKLRPARVD